MRERDREKNRRETIHALAMIMQIGLAILVCMGMSLAIGIYVDRLFQTKTWVLVMMVIGILASVRSMLVLTGHYGSNAHSGDGRTQGKERYDENGKEDAD